MDMGQRIKELRIKNGLTQEELGKYIGVQKSAIRKYEKGEVKNIKSSSIKILSKIFNISPSYLMCIDEPKENSSNTSVISIPFFNNSNIDSTFLLQDHCQETIEISTDIAITAKDFFAFKVIDDSMSPIFIENDIVIVKKQSNFELDDFVVIFMNNNILTIRKVIKASTTLLLKPINDKYTYNEIGTISGKIIGIVKQLKRDF